MLWAAPVCAARELLFCVSGPGTRSSSSFSLCDVVRSGGACSGVGSRVKSSATGECVLLVSRVKTGLPAREAGEVCVYCAECGVCDECNECGVWVRLCGGDGDPSCVCAIGTVGDGCESEGATGLSFTHTTHHECASLHFFSCRTATPPSISFNELLTSRACADVISAIPAIVCSIWLSFSLYLYLYLYLSLSLSFSFSVSACVWWLWLLQLRECLGLWRRNTEEEHTLEYIHGRKSERMWRNVEFDM